MKYARLNQREKELMTLFDETKERNYLMEHYNLITAMDIGTFKTYELIREKAISLGIDTVYDIGCAYGFQSEVFLEGGVGYTGIDDYGIENYWNAGVFEYITKPYPFKIEASENAIAISVLCLTWNCYLYEGDKTLEAQLSALKRDFKQCILYVAKDKVDAVAKYYEKYDMISDGLYHFYN